MLIRSRSRGGIPMAPDQCDFLCGNVFYMPQNVPQNLPQMLPPPRRPSSAVERRTALKQTDTRPGKPRKPLCAIKTPKRVIQGSTFDAKQSSKFHERCLPDWIPAPAMSSKNSKARLKAKEDRRSSYPLCLVCEYDHDYEEESVHQLYEKFQKGALHFEELDNEIRVKANQQKVKVLDTLWKMDLQSRQRIADEIRKKNDEEIRSQAATDDEAPSWHDILKEKEKKRKPRRRKLKKDNYSVNFSDQESNPSLHRRDSTSSISIPDVDLTPDHDWSINAERIKETKAMVHKEVSDINEDKNLNRAGEESGLKKVKKEKLKVVPDIKKGSATRVQSAKVTGSSPKKGLENNASKNVTPLKKLELKKNDDKPHLYKGTPNKRTLKPKREESKVVERKVKPPPGKLIKGHPKVIKDVTVKQVLPEQLDGKSIFPVSEPDPDLQSRRESTIPDDDDDTGADDLSLSDNGIKGTCILIGKDEDKKDSKEKIVDPIKDYVEQCNAENDGGDAKLQQEKDENTIQADFKQEIISRRSSKSDSIPDDLIAEDIIKEFVDKEFDLENCLTKFKEHLTDEKLISNNKRSRSDSSICLSKSQNDNNSNNKDKDVFADIIIDELKRENRDLKFALVTRDQRLEDAANKVAELVEQNTYLSQKVERAAMDYTKQNDELVQIQKDFEKQFHDLNKKLAQVEEKRSLESTALDSSGAMLEATINDLSDRLKKSEESNSNLQTYIEQLKKSYQTVFGNTSSSQSQ